MNFKKYLIESSPESALQHIADHAKPRKSFSVSNQEIKKGNGFENELADNSAFYFELFGNKLLSLVKYYSALAAPYGIALDINDILTSRNGVNVPGVFKIMWHQDFPADILLQFAKKYAQLVVDFLPKLIYVSQNNVSPEDWYYTYVHTKHGKDIDSVMILLYEKNPYK